MQTTHQQTELEQAQAILDEAQGALQGGCESTDSQTAETERARAQWEKDLARRDAELAEREQQLEEIKMQQDEVASVLEQRTADLRRQLAELERQQAALLTQSETTEQQAQLQSTGLSAEESQAICEAPGGESVSARDRRRTAAAQLSKLVNDAASPDAGEAQSRQQGSEARRRNEAADEDLEDEVAQPKAVERAAPAQRATDEEQSIEQYMAGLLNRMRGGNGADVVIARERKPIKQEEAPPLVTEVKQPAPPAEPVVSSQRLIDVHMAPVEMERRSTTAAEVSDLAAMRELANNHARIAIDTHGKKQLLKMALGLWIGGIGAAAGALVGFCVLPTEDFGLRTGCVVGLLVSGYWTYRAVAVTRKILAATPAAEVPAATAATQAADAPKAS